MQGRPPECGPGRCYPGHHTCAAGTQWSCLQTSSASPQGSVPDPIPGSALQPCHAAYHDWAPGRGRHAANVLLDLGGVQWRDLAHHEHLLPAARLEAACDQGLSVSFLTLGLTRTSRGGFVINIER
uniref:Uncharacterized protein n=1 Tax=Pipistrellus kuhlii TaxID=59472 RepID=A0A7J8B1Z3_PIPKU|nr:hypothetical protein mPipKuh1_007906 [Pipistrellus kuhlii]